MIGIAGHVERWVTALCLVAVSCGANESGERAVAESDTTRSIDARVTLNDGSLLVLRGDTGEVSDHARYEDVGPVESLRAHLLKVNFYEGWGYLLVSLESGDTTWVAGPPVVSPSRRQFVATSLDLVAEYNPNVIEVFRVEGRNFTLEYKLVPEDFWGPSGARWIGEDTIAFSMNVPNERLEYEQTPARLVRTDGTWSVE